MAPRFDFGDWWSKEEHEGTPVVVKMENPNWDMLELNGPPQSGGEIGKGRNKNAKQLTWVLLLKAHRAAGCVAYLATGLWTLLSAIQNRIIAPKASGVKLDKPVKGKLYRFIRAFLVTALVMLGIDYGAHMLGWHFTPPAGVNLINLPHAIYMGWMVIRLQYIGPALQLAADSCIVLFLIQSADRITQFMGFMYVKFRGIKPIPANPSFESDDPEMPDKGYPMVLIQIPMCNEREVLNLFDRYLYNVSFVYICGSASLHFGVTNEFSEHFLCFSEKLKLGHLSFFLSSPLHYTEGRRRCILGGHRI